MATSSDQGARPGAAGTERADRVRELLTPAVTAAGYDLEGVSLAKAGRRTLVRVTVDADGGIDLDAVADVSRVISDVLDTAEADVVLPGPFVLEVSSPGVDRLLSEPRHWRRAVGRLVGVPVGERTVSGRVGAVDDRGVRLTVDGAPMLVGWDDLGAGRVTVEFTHAADLPDSDLPDSDEDEED